MAEPQQNTCVDILQEDISNDM